MRPHITRYATGDASFGELDQDPAFHASWLTVQAQLQNEGSGQTDIDAAKYTMAGAYNQLLLASPSLSGQDLIDSAQQFAMMSRTAAGAISHIDGLVKAIQAGGVMPGQVVQLFTGTLVGITIAAGTIGAGVGAAIIAGAELAAVALNSLFSPPAGVTICGRTFSSDSGPDPAYAVGCFPMWGKPGDPDGPPVSPTAKGWLRFPKPGDQTQHFGDWYGQGFPVSAIGWNVTYARPIDVAWPTFHHMECEDYIGYAMRGIMLRDIGLVRAGAVIEFCQSFHGAWMTNAERQLNGQGLAPSGAQSGASVPVDEWQILAHLIDIWNRAHEPTDFFEFEPAPESDRIQPSDPCPVAGEKPPYVATLTQRLYNSLQQNDQQRLMPNGKIRINVGPRKTTSPQPGKQLHPCAPGQHPTLGHMCLPMPNLRPPPSKKNGSAVVPLVLAGLGLGAIIAIARR